MLLEASCVRRRSDQYTRPISKTGVWGTGQSDTQCPSDQDWEKLLGVPVEFSPFGI